jgi:DNA-binding response OmpR family regulator
MPISTIVLIVEDEVLTRNLLESAFIEAGYEVCILSSGPEAMSFLDGCSDSPRGLVTDIDLGAAPNGWQIGRRARELSPLIAVIYTSGDSEHEWGAQGVADSLMVHKPFSPAQVVSAMGELLDAHAT